MCFILYTSDTQPSTLESDLRIKYMCSYSPFIHNWFGWLLSKYIDSKLFVRDERYWNFVTVP